METTTSIIRVGKPKLRDRHGGISDAGIARRLRAKLLPSPFYELGRPYWIESELNAIDQARVRGADDDAVRQLVRELEAARNAPQPQAA